MVLSNDGSGSGTSSGSEAVAVAVAIRVRPLSTKEERSEPGLEQSYSWKIDTANNFIQMNENSYQFDHVFGTSASTSDLYNNVAKDVVTSSMQGINGTIFAYGQTGSGKTFTMQGSREYPGVIPHAISDVFHFIQNNPSREFCLRVSYLEIYNEIIKDLLDPSKVNLKIHENVSGDLFVGDLTEKAVLGPGDVMELLVKGQSNRNTAATNMNEASSRSHSIFKLVIESRQRPNLSADEDDQAAAECVDGGISVASLHLVDLAGSERVAHTGARGVRLKEGTHINKSLLTLGKCIRRLSEGERGHIPYRDSKLTRILSPALGGNTRTLIVCNVTSASLHVDETLSTLGFASRAKTIQNSVHKNEVVDSETQIRRLEREIAGLRVQLEARAESASVPLRQECAEKSLALQEARKQAQALQRFLLSAATLQDNAADAGPGCYHGTTELSLGRSNQSRRRRTFDPASFSTPALNQHFGLRRPPLLPPSLAIAAEENRSSVGSITSQETRSSVGSPSKSEMEALSFRVSQLQRERDQAVEDAAQIKKEFVSLNETHAQVLSKLDSEKKFLVSRCAVAESKLELMDIRLKDFGSLKEERKQMVIDLQEAREQKEAVDQELLTFREAELKWNESVRKLEESGERESLLEQNSQEMESRIESLQEKFQQSETELNLSIDVRKQLSEELLVLKRRSHELSESNELLHGEKEVLEMSLREAQQQSATANGELEVMSARVSNLESELSSCLADLSASQTLAREQAGILRLPASKQERAARNAADKAIKTAENKLSQMRAKVENLESIGREHVRERQVSTGQRQALERQLKALERQLNLKDKQLQQSTQVQNNTKAMQSRIDEGERENESLKHEIAAKTHEFMELKSISGAVNRELSASRREVEELQGLVSQLNPVRIAYEEASRDLTSARSSLAESEALVLALKQENTDSNELRQQLQVLQQSHEALQKAKAEAEKRALEVHLKLEEAEAKAEARIQLLSSEKESVCGELRETRVLLSNQERAFKAHQQMVKDEEEARRKKLQQSQQQNAKEHEQRMSKLVLKLEEVEQEKLVLHQRNQRLDVQLREVERTRQKQETLLNSAHEERQATESELLRLRTLQHTLTDSIEALKADKTGLQSKIDRVGKRYESTLQQLQSLQDQEQELVSPPPARPATATATATIEALKQEITELKATASQLRQELEHKKKHPLSSKQMLQLVQASKRYAMLKEQANKENKH